MDKWQPQVKAKVHLPKNILLWWQANFTEEVKKRTRLEVLQDISLAGSWCKHRFFWERGWYCHERLFFFIIPFTFGTFIDFLHSPKQGRVQGSHAASSSCTKSSPFHLGWTYTSLVSPVHPVCGLQGTQQAAHSPLPLPPTASHVLAHPSRFSSVIGNPTLFTVFFPRSFSVSLITFVIYSQAFPIFLIPQSPFIQLGTAKLQRLSSF